MFVPISVDGLAKFCRVRPGDVRPGIAGTRAAFGLLNFARTKPLSERAGCARRMSRRGEAACDKRFA
jgi:hypothetical protein